MSEEKERRRRKEYASSEKDASEETGVIWSDAKARLERGDIIPFIGNSISTDLVFGESYEQILAEWAKKLNCPWPAQQDVAAVAQYSIMREDEPAAKSSFLRFIKDRLLDIADKDDAISDNQFKKAEENWMKPSYSFTDLAKDLGYLSFEEKPEHPLSILAKLPFRIYITTSRHRFLEVALEKFEKKEYHSEIYPWNADLENRAGSIFRENPSWEPSKDKPLIYHLYGIDNDHTSLVLTEEDYLDFLIKITQDSGMTHVGGLTSSQGDPIDQGLPSVIGNALVHNSSPLLLGYKLLAWDFRILFRGLVAAKTPYRRGDGICIQLLKDCKYLEDEIKNNLQKYLTETCKLNIYWGTPEECLQKLEKVWRG